jgi:heat shock protein HslJ
MNQKDCEVYMHAKMSILVTLFVVSLLALAACGGGSDDLAGEWFLAELNGAPPVPGTNVSIAFNQDEVSGSGGCNAYGGSYTLRGKGIQFGNLAMTLMACMDEAINQQEADFFTALSQVDSWEVSGNTLTLSGGSATIVFTRGGPEADSPQAENPQGTWRLVQVNGAPADPVTEFILIFDAPDAANQGALNGWSGCATYTGTYTAGGGSLVFNELTMTAMSCTDGSVAEAERAYLQQLQQVAGYVLAGGQLILGGEGVELVYAANDSE